MAKQNHVSRSRPTSRGDGSADRNLPLPWHSRRQSDVTDRHHLLTQPPPPNCLPMYVRTYAGDRHAAACLTMQKSTRCTHQSLHSTFQHRRDLDLIVGEDIIHGALCRLYSYMNPTTFAARADSCLLLEGSKDGVSAGDGDPRPRLNLRHDH